MTQPADNNERDRAESVGAERPMTQPADNNERDRVRQVEAARPMTGRGDANGRGSVGPARPMRRRRIDTDDANGEVRLDRRQLWLGLVVVGVMALMTWVSIIAINGIPFSDPYKLRALLPPSAPIVRHGDEVLVAGQRVGQVRKIHSTPQGRLIEMDIDKGRVGRDARAGVRLRGLAGAIFIDLQRGDEAHPAPENWTIPLARTSTGTQLTDVVAAFDRDTRGALGRTLDAYGHGLAGSGEHLNAALADLPPLLTGATPLLRSMTPRPGALAGFVDAFDGTARGFAGQRSDDLAGLITAGRGAFHALAAERPALGATIDIWRPFEDEALATLPVADPVLDEATRAVRALTPGVRALDRALPNVNALLARRAEVGQLARLARAADPVLRVLDPVLTRLYPGAASLAPLAGAVQPLAAYAARYPDDILAGPTGFTTWGGFRYGDLQAKGHRAVRFAPVFTCAISRNPYPEPGTVGKDRQPCGF